MKPSDKSPELEAEITRLFGFDRRACIEAGVCVPPPVGCGRPINSAFPNIGRPFRDLASAREYTVSGLCQACQDKIWRPKGAEL